MKQIFTYIKAAKFFPKYAPNVIAWKKKMSGKNTNGNPLDFTDSDKAAIKTGVAKLFKDVTKY